MFFEGAFGQYMKPSYRGTKPRAVDARWPKEVALFPSVHAPHLALLRRRWRHPHRARAAPPWSLLVLVRASAGTHGDTIFGENDTSARLASELLAQVAPSPCHYLSSPARINIFDCGGYHVSHWPVTGKSDIKRLRARCQFRASWRAYNPPGHGPPSAHRRRGPG